MTLYTINGNYPDKNFNFAITSEDLGLAQVVHGHAISDINNLDYRLNLKSELDHTHEAFRKLNVDNQEVVGNITIEGVLVDVGVNGSVIELDLNLTGQGDIIGFKNTNPKRKHTTTRISTSQVLVSDDSLVLNLLPQATN